MGGTVVACLEYELYQMQIEDEDGTVTKDQYADFGYLNLVLRLLLSLSTLALVILLIRHAYNYFLLMKCKKKLQPNTLFITSRYFKYLLGELLLCSVHNLPGVNMFIRVD